jgi:single-stranded-DNA-specific exonuclease
VASQIIELFCTRDAARAQELAATLELLNRQRREAEAAALILIEARLASDAEFAGNCLLVVDGEGWHRGVIGILASRVVERTAKPAIVVSVEDNVAHGSGRSVDGFQLLEALESCGDLFTRFGGHAFAVGFAMPAAAVPELRRRLNEHAKERLGASEPEHLLRIHAELPLDRVTPVLAGWLKKLEPLGHGNPEPIFMARGARIATAPRIMKDRHIRLELHQDSFGSGGGVTRCVGWDWAERCLNMQLSPGSKVDVAYRIRENDHPSYGGIEIEIAAIRSAEA